jgi:hypothetical protein
VELIGTERASVIIPFDPSMHKKYLEKKQK